MAKRQQDLRGHLRGLLTQLYLQKEAASPSAKEGVEQRIQLARQQLKRIGIGKPFIQSPVIVYKRPTLLHFCPSCGTKIYEGQACARYGAIRLCNYHCLHKYMFGVPNEAGCY